MSRFTFSINRPIATGMLFLALIVFGLKSYQELSLNLLPDISYPTLTVRTKYASAAPEEVENLVSIPLEEAVGTVGGLVKMSSISRSGLSEVILEFEWKTDMDMAALDVREKLDRVNLPDEAEKPIILRYNPSLDPIIRFGLSGSEDLFLLRRVAEDIVKKEIEGLTGVAAVKVKGGFEEEILVRLDERRVASVGLTVDQIGNRLRFENVNLAGGSLREGRAEYLVRTLNEFQTLDDIADVVVGKHEGAEIRLSEIATVERGHKEREVITRINGRESVEIEIHKEADSNTVRVADAVKDKIGLAKKAGVFAQRRKGSPETGPDGASFRRRRDVISQLPSGVKLDIIADQSEFIKRAIAEVKSAAVIGGVLAFLVLYLFLNDARTTVMIGIAIPISIIATFLPMFVANVSLNIMSLGGLALGLGMLVDNSIVVLESIYRCREDGDSLPEAATRGLVEVRGAVVASTITTIAVFFPIVFVSGIASQIFSDLALTVTFSLLSSLVVALFLNPMLVSREYHVSDEWLKRERATRPGLTAARSWIKTEWARIPFDRTRASIWRLPAALPLVLASFLSFVLKVLAQAVLVLLVALAYVLFLVVGFLWKQGAVVIRLVSYPFLTAFGKIYSAVAYAYPVILRAALANRLLVIIMALTLLGHCVYLLPRLGGELMPKIHEGRFGIRAEKSVGTPIELMERSIIPIEKSAMAQPLVKTVFSSIGSESSSTEATEFTGSNVAHLDVALKDAGSDVYAQEAVMESLRRELAKLTDMRIRFVEPNPFTFRTSVEVEVEGYDLELLRQIGEEMEDIVAGIEGLRDIRLNIESGTPEMHINFNSEKIASMGMTVSDLAGAIRTKVKGDVPTQFSRGDDKIDIRLKASEADVGTLEAVKNLIVSSPAGIPVPLSAVADVSISPGPSEIRRIDQRRTALITANVSARDLGSIAREIRQKAKSVPLPSGYTISMGGQFEEMETSLSSLRLALLLAVFLVYAVMAAQFESVVLPFIIIFSIPLAFIGVVYALYFFNVPPSIVVFIGGIVLAGVVVNDAIVLVDYINQLRAKGLAIQEAIMKGCQTRLRPVLMTTMTTVLGLTPMAIGMGEGSEIRRPLAITVVAGLLSATFLTLIVIPSIYSVFARERKREQDASPEG